jgi:hypothetical protein
VALPDAAKSRAILIGVGRYAHLPDIQAVRNNVATLHGILTGAKSWNLSQDHCVTVHDPKTPEELVDPIYQGAQEATDTLLVYYAGHGLRGESRGELRLTRATSRTQASHTSTDYNEIREILLSTAASRRIVILDCCYAASSLGVMSDPANSIADEALIEGTYLIAAAGETQAAMADNGAGFTVFTGELVDLLHNGVPDATQKYLSLDAVFAHLQNSLKAKARPLPHRRVRNSPGGLAISLNNQWRAQVIESAHSVSDIPHLGPAVVAGKSEHSRPGAWPTATDQTSSPVSDKKPAPAPATPRPGAWPTAQRTPPGELPQNVGSVRDFWPVILEAVKERRRFAWLVLSLNAQIPELDGRNLLIRFVNEGSKNTYHSAGVDKILESVLLDEFNLPWVVTVMSENSLEDSVAMGSDAAHVRQAGRWPDLAAGTSGSNTAPEGSGSAGTGDSDHTRNSATWPPVAKFNPLKKVSNLHTWPDVLEEVKGRRRYAWLVLNNHATVTQFDETSVVLEFENHSARNNYHHSGIHELLKAVLRDKLGREYTVRAVTRPSG